MKSLQLSGSSDVSLFPGAGRVTLKRGGGLCLLDYLLNSYFGPSTVKASEKLESKTSAVKEMAIFRDKQDQLESDDERPHRH